MRLCGSVGILKEDVMYVDLGILGKVDILGNAGILESVEGPEGCKGLDGVEDEEGIVP